MPSAEPVPDELGRWARVVVVGLVLLLGVHFVLTALWLAPSSQVRDAVGGRVLSAYVDPYFTQGADTLGIGSNRVDEALQIRASVRDSVDGKSRTTPWLDVTKIETTALKGDLDPARAHQAARRLATTMNFAVLSLTQTQRKLLPEIEAGTPRSQVRAELLKADPDERRAVFNFDGADEMLRRYASLWLDATYDDVEVLDVSYRVGRRQVPDVADRRTDTLSGRPFEWFELGWRTAYRGTPEARKGFTDYVRSRRG